MSWTKCAETEHCFFQEYKGRNNLTRYCMALTTKDDRPPYRDGHCPFYKKNATDIGHKRKEPLADGSQQKDGESMEIGSPSV